MTQPLSDERRVTRLAGQVVFLKRCLGVAALLVLGLIVVNVFLARAVFARRTARAILIDSKKMCLVRSEADARKVYQQLLELKRGNFKGEVTFKQNWQHKAWPANGEEVLSCEEAVKLLAPKLNALADAWAIQINGRDVAYMKTQELTEAVKQGLMSKYVAAGDALALPQKIPGWKVANVQVDPSKVSDQVGATVQALTQVKEQFRTYKVLRGQTKSGVCQKFHMTTDELYRLNPGLRGRMLQAGETIKVAGEGPAVVVITIKQEVRDVPYQLEPERVELSSRPRGEKEIVPGKAGRKRITKEVIYDNDRPRPQARTQKAEIIEDAVPDRIIVGTGPPR